MGLTSSGAGATSEVGIADNRIADERTVQDFKILQSVIQVQQG